MDCNIEVVTSWTSIDIDYIIYGIQNYTKVMKVISGLSLLDVSSIEDTMWG